MFGLFFIFLHFLNCFFLRFHLPHSDTSYSYSCDSASATYSHSQILTFGPFGCFCFRFWVMIIIFLNGVLNVERCLSLHHPQISAGTIVVELPLNLCLDVHLFLCRMADSDSTSFGTSSPSVNKTDIVPGWLLISPTPSMLSHSDYSSPETTKKNKNRSSHSGTEPSESFCSETYAVSDRSGCYMNVNVETATQAELQHADNPENTMKMKLGSSTVATIGYQNQISQEAQVQSEAQHKVVHTSSTTTTYSLRKRTSCQTPDEEDRFRRAFSDPDRLVRCEAVFETPKKHKSFCQCPFEPKLDIHGKCFSCRRVVVKVPDQANKSESDGDDSQDPDTPSGCGNPKKFRKVIAPQTGKVKLAMKVNFEIDSMQTK